MQLPEKFVEQISNCDGCDVTAFLHAHTLAPPVSIRYNTRKIFSLPDHLQKVPWCASGFYLPERPQFTLDPLLHAGCYYVQEASSMFLEYVLKQTIDFNSPVRILDLCAAPGGKSTLVSSLLNEKSLLVSNEVIKTRVAALKENITKWGDEHVAITNNDAADFSKLQNYFDVIIIDAPCSGSGLFRKDASAVNAWSTELVKLCSLRQQRILDDVIPALKENGILIYSTCSYSTEENETVVQKLLAEKQFEIIYVPLTENLGIIKNNSGFRFYPDKLKGEGFFLSVLRKCSNTSAVEVFEGRNVFSKIEKLSNANLQLMKNYITNADIFEFFTKEKNIFAYPAQIAADMHLLSASLKVVKAGIFCGEMKGKDFIPTHELALCSKIQLNFPAVSVDKETALQYLRKQELKSDEFFANNLYKGWVLIQYEGHTIGWAKILENRINNYYPTEWRIKNL